MMESDLTEPRKRTDDNGKVINAYVADFYNSELLVVARHPQVLPQKTYRKLL